MDMQKLDEGEQDVSYDSNFILGVMDDIGNDTCSSYHRIGVVDKEVIYMVKDNVVGHETN